MQTNMDANASPPAAPETLLRISQVEARVGLRKSSVYQLVKQGRFPAPVRISHKYSCWPASAIDAWIRDRIAAARKAGA